MKTLVSHFTRLLQARTARRNLAILFRFTILLVSLVTLYTVLFHWIMRFEGQEHSWVSGLYWTLVTMSTLGFGDIAFRSDLGRIFSVVVLLSGILMLLVMLPFTFIQFFYAPWVEAQSAARAPRSLPVRTRGHVILTDYDALSTSLIPRLSRFSIPYVVIEPDLGEALKLHDLGVSVMVGPLDSPETYRNAHAEQAAMVVTARDDEQSANIIFSVREVAGEVPLVAVARARTAAPILKLAGATHVIDLPQMMGDSLARRAIGGDAMTHVIGGLDQLQIAEAAATRTPLVGKTIRENRLTEIGVSVVGVWERGRFEIATPETMITDRTVLVLAGDKRQLESYDEAMAIYNTNPEPVVLIGAGGVGRAAAAALARRGIPFRVIEKRPDLCAEAEDYIVGDASDPEVLRKAGVLRAPTVFVTTHEDNTNIYLTILLRHLRPDIQIISRSTLERNVSTLHRAGADFVLSSASMAASIVMNLLRRASILTLAEGLNVIRLPMPRKLVGATLARSEIRQQTGMRVLAVVENQQMRVNPDPHAPLPPDAELILIGSPEAEARFVQKYMGE